MGDETCPRCKGELVAYEPGESFHVEEMRNLGVCLRRPDGIFECVRGSGLLPAGSFRLDGDGSVSVKGR
jgi:hypothetical protein